MSRSLILTDFNQAVFYVCHLTGRLHIQRSVQSSVRVKFGEDFRLDWDGRGRVLLKVKEVVYLKDVSFQ